MAGWTIFTLAVVFVAAVSVSEARVIPAEPISVMLDSYGNPIVFLREKRTAVHPYPHRAMMFTGYYRPVRRSSNSGQATGVFAQGNAVSGETFFGGVQTPHLKDGPEPIEEPEISSAEAQAAPAPEDSYNDGGEEQVPQVEEENGYQPNGQQDVQGQHQEQEQQQQDGQQQHQEEQQQQDEEQRQHDQPQQDSVPPQEQQEPEQVPVYTTEVAAPTPAEDPAPPKTEVSANRPKVHQGKKTRKPVVPVEEDDEDDYEEDDEPVVPFVPFKGNRRRQGYPNLNNFFPMVFSFPGASTRSGTPGSPPGTITAIANSYSTGKGGVASSVATAYGGSPNGKKRRTPPSEE